MKLIKPTWVNHDDLAIFSIDISPDGKRFATGGQGPDCGRVVIWNIEPVINEEAEKKDDVPKIFCQLDHHLACVNCVRWSKDNFLASGGDDKLIVIWKLIPGLTGVPVFGSSLKTCAETWKAHTTLRGHAGDILDLAWAPHKPWLASASVDNSVIIWDMTSHFIIKVLKGHTGLVKGVTWDPIGQYIATQSDDKTLKVWKTSFNWEVQANITEPFEECGGTTHVLRLSWSPDGQYLVSAHAMNGGGPTAQIIERDTWKLDNDFVGHRKAITCTRFNGIILEPLNGSKDSQKKPKFCCVAIGSRDRSLSVWSTYLQRPVVVIRDLFIHSVLDISWSPCGLRLCACSKDGTVCFIEFSQNELGKPLNIGEVLEIQEKIYGKLSRPTGPVLIEDPSLLVPKDTSDKEMQKESKTISKSSDDDAEMSSSLPTIPIPLTPTPTISASSTVPTMPSTSNISVSKQIETRTVDGKRRITPMFIPVTSNQAGPSTSTATSSQTPKTTAFTDNADKSAEHSRYQMSQEKKRLEEKLKELPSYRFRDNDNNKDDPKDKEESFKDNFFNGNNESSRPKHYFTPLKPKGSMAYQIPDYLISISGADDELFLIELHQTSDDKKILWTSYIGYKPLAVAATSSIVAIATEDGSIHVFHTKKGLRASPPLAPPKPLAKLRAEENRLMSISCNADIRVWDINPVPRILVSTSADYLVTNNAYLLYDDLYNGMPMLAFTNGKAFMFHTEMGTWILIGDGYDAALRWAKYSAYSSTLLKLGLKPKGPLGRLQGAINKFIGYPDPNPDKINYSPAAVMSYFEHQVTTAKAIKSHGEYSVWMMNYVKFLITHDGLENRLRLILDDLLGCTTSNEEWNLRFPGSNKHDLLEEVLSLIAQEPQWQRIYMEYKEQLDIIKKDAAMETASNKEEAYEKYFDIL